MKSGEFSALPDAGENSQRHFRLGCSVGGRAPLVQRNAAELGCQPLLRAAKSQRVSDEFRQPTREVYCEDALPWLQARTPLRGCSLITSLPDVSGLPGSSLATWKQWFIGAARQSLNATADDGVTIFYQTDIKVAGTWVDKSFLCQLAAEHAGAELLWHKIVCRRPAGQVSFGRPAYSHMLCFSRGVKDRVARSYADVLPGMGKMTWSQAMGVEACRLACRYVISHTETRTVVDPFCGVGTALAVANTLGLDAIGVELGKKRARRAHSLQLPTE